MARPEISVVVPVFNEKKRIKKTLNRLVGYLERHSFAYEVIVMDDGSTDGTHEILNSYPAKPPKLIVIRSAHNHGKGYAVRKGILEASGRIIFFTDADLSTPVREIGKFMELMNKNSIPILIGSRSLPGSKLKIRQPCYRQNMGRIFNLFVKLSTPLRYEDTQCGFKAFRRHAAEKIFSHAKLNGFTFDVEALLLARKYGFETEEIPVTWVNSRRSQVRPFSDSLNMFRALINIRKRYQQT